MSVPDVPFVVAFPGAVCVTNGPSPILLNEVCSERSCNIRTVRSVEWESSSFVSPVYDFNASNCRSNESIVLKPNDDVLSLMSCSSVSSIESTHFDRTFRRAEFEPESNIEEHGKVFRQDQHTLSIMYFVYLVYQC